VCLGAAAVTGRADAMAAPPASKAREPDTVAREAQRRFRLGDYDLAAELFVGTHELSGRPALILNAASAHEKAGNVDRAVALFERYIAPAASLLHENRTRHGPRRVQASGQQ